MLKEFIDTIAKMAVKSTGPQIGAIDPYSPWSANDTHGNIVVNTGLPPPRKHTALDLVTIAEFAKRFDSAAIWYSRARIVAVIDDNDRRNTVTLTMNYSDELLKLAELQRAKPWFDQRSILTLLRTVFTPMALPGHTTLIDSLRVVKFEAGQTANTDIGRGKSSVGKSAMATVEGWDKLPEVVTLEVPIFTNSFIRDRAAIRCALEVNEQEQKFQLFPLPGSVELAISNIEARLAGMLRELLPESTPTYYGEM